MLALSSLQGGLPSPTCPSPSPQPKPLLCASLTQGPQTFSCSPAPSGQGWALAAYMAWEELGRPR